MAAPCLYLDIDDTGISACKGTAASPDRIVRVAYREPAAQDPQGDLPEQGSRLKQALGALAQETDISDCRHAVVLVPPSWASFRHTSLPFTQEKKIRQVLPLETAPGLPDPDEAVLTDFHVLDASRELRFEDDLHLVFSAAMAEEKIKEIHDSLSAYKISLRVVCPRGHAQAMAFAAGQDALKNFLHIHIAGRETVMTLVMEGHPLVIRSLTGTLPDKENIAREITRTLTGAGLRTGLPQEAFEDLTVVVQAADPEIDTGLDPGTARFIASDPFPVVIAPDSQPPFLFNFCTGPYRADSFVIQYKKQLGACLVLAILAFALSVAGLYRQSAVLEEQVARVRQTAAAVYKEAFPGTGAKLAATPLLLMESKIRQARKTRSGNAEGNAAKTGSDIRVMDILNDLSGRIPAGIDMEITRLVLNHGRLILTGATDNFNNVDKIKGLIQASPRFKNVSINSAEAGKTGSKDKGVRFKFIVEM
ncbi:MAG: PilN domain-containing protein [Desulfobacterales bacterium]|nr:PilN domain-containing protein [Desulfobacterales bacterium]